MKHHYSTFNKQTDLLKALIEIHLGGRDIECDFTYNKGNFYKDGVNRPKECYDINPLFDFVKKTDNTIYHKGERDKLNSIVIDPPFMIANRKSQREYYSSQTHGAYESFNELENAYIGFLRNAYTQLKQNGICIFKCQDFTDAKTIMTHCYVWKWAENTGFYVKDIAILNNERKIFNSQLKQRHLRKTHTYFFILQKKYIKEWYKDLCLTNAISRKNCCDIIKK